MYYAIKILGNERIKAGFASRTGAIVDVAHAELLETLPDAYRWGLDCILRWDVREIARIVRLTPQQARPQLPWDDDRLPDFAWPGGYTIAYYTRDGAMLCADCARRELAEVDGADTYDEGPDVNCEGCNATLESSYGELEDCHD